MSAPAIPALIEDMGGIGGALKGHASCLEELRLLMRRAKAATPAERRAEGLAPRIAEMLECVRSISEDLVGYRRATDKLPCLGCGSPFLPHGSEWPVCPRCGAEHWTCPVCGQDQVSTDGGCMAGCEL